MGKLSLKDLASVISKADFFVGTDTGATHLSALVGVPTIVVFSGVADHNIWEPLGKSVCIVRKPIACAPCHIARIDECVAQHKCMRDIEVEDVYRAFYISQHSTAMWRKLKTSVTSIRLRHFRVSNEWNLYETFHFV